MKKIRFLSAMLALLMAGGSLAACANEGDPTQTNGQTYWSGTEEESALKDNLPDDLFYDDDEITIISRYVEGWTSGEIAVEGLKSESVNDAVFERNKKVEERLGVKIISIEDSTSGADAVVNKVALAVKGGNKEYDVMAAPCYTTLPETLNGTFVNLRATEYLDFDKPWWTQGFNAAALHKDTQYALLGSMLLSMYRFGFVTVFNKDIFTDANQPFLYEYVENGSWTLDKQASLVPLLYKENGDGIRDDNGDIYGFVSSNETSIDAYWSACKLDIITTTPEGEYEFVLDMERLHGVTDKLLQLFYETNGGTRYFALKEADAEQKDIRKMFANGFAAMASLRMLELENSEMRSMEQEYGVVPIPKYDEAQDGYATLLHDQFTVVCIPVTVTDERLDEVTAVLEAMSSASYQIVKPAYYETTLRTTIAQDPQSADMMDIITDNVYIDPGIIYISSLGSFHHGLRDVVMSHTNNSVSLFKARVAACKKSLEKISRKLENVALIQSKP